jgi:hypothetical protein
MYRADDECIKSCARIEGTVDRCYKTREIVRFRALSACFNKSRGVLRHDIGSFEHLRTMSC